MLRGLRGIKLEDVGEVRGFVAGRIADGMRDGTNVAELQQSLQDSHSGRSSGTGDMLRALSGGKARDNGAGSSESSASETPNAW